MSHLAKIELEITDLNALDRACKKLGFELAREQKTYKWFGRWVGDAPLPEGLDRNKLGECEHAIKVPGAKYEVGVIKRDSGKYSLLFDEWVSGGLVPKIGKDGGKIKQHYAIEKAKIEAIRKGYRIRERVVDNKIQLTVIMR